MDFFDIQTKLQDSTLPGRDFDRLSQTRLKQCSSLSEAHTYLNELDAEYHKVKLSPHHPAYDTYRLVSQLARHAVPIYLTKEKEIYRIISGFRGLPATQVRLYVLQCGGRHFKVDYADGFAIFIDRNIVVRDSLFFLSFYFGFPDESPLLAGYIALFASVYSTQPLPFLDELLWYAMGRAGDELVGTLVKLVHLIVLHEIGHIYSNACEPEHPDFIVRSLEAPISNSDAKEWHISVPLFLAERDKIVRTPHQVQVGEFFLLNGHKNNHFIPHGLGIHCNEFFCDFYAWYNMVVLSQISEHNPVARLHDDKQLDWLLTIVASSLFLQELDQQSKNGFRQDAIPELITLNPWGTRNLSHPHPRGLLRWQSLAIHSCTLGGLAPWDRHSLEPSFKLGFDLFRYDNFALANAAASLHSMSGTPRRSWNDTSHEKFIARQQSGKDRWRNLSAEMAQLTWHVYGARLFENQASSVFVTKDPLSGPGSALTLSLLVAALGNARFDQPVWTSEFSERLIDIYRKYNE